MRTQMEVREKEGKEGKEEKRRKEKKREEKGREGEKGRGDPRSSCGPFGQVRLSPAPASFLSLPGVAARRRH